MSARTFLTETGTSVVLPAGTAARIGAGGQGQVFRCAINGEVLAIKLVRQLEEQRLIALQRLGLRCGPVATWPSQRLFHSCQGQRGDLAGYAMRCIESGRSVSAAQLFNFEEIEALRRFTWRDAVLAGLRLSESVAQLHRHGVVIGDLNPENVLFEQQAGPGEAGNWRAVLLDSDSFQIATEEGRFLCPVSRPPYTAPELISTDFNRSWREPSSDSFALAVILYQLLLHDHPYDNALFAEDPELAVTGRIRRGLYPHAALPATGLQPGPYRPAPAQINAAIDAAFRRSFSSLPALRPTAAEWALLLRTLHRQVVPCAKNRRHMHPRGEACLWCAIEARLGQPLCRFSSAAAIKPQGAAKAVDPPEAATATRAGADSPSELVQLLQYTLQQARDLVQRRAELIEQALQLEPVLAGIAEQSNLQERSLQDRAVLARLQGVRQRLSRWLGHQQRVQQRQQLAEQLIAQGAETAALTEQQGKTLEQQRRSLLQALAQCGTEALAERLALHDPRRQAQRMGRQAAELSQGQWLRQQLAEQRLRDWRIEGFGEGRWQLLEHHGLERGDQLLARIDQLTSLQGIGPGLQQRLRRHLQAEVALLEARGSGAPLPELERSDLPRLLGEGTLEILTSQQAQISRLDGDLATLAQAIEALEQQRSERNQTRQELLTQFEALF